VKVSGSKAEHQAWPGHKGPDRIAQILPPTRFVLHPLCRVRKEVFGLLFYDLRGPRLLFVETGTLLEPGELREGLSAGETTARGEPLARLLKNLVAKGFLCEQPIC
jgi:putative mycofactocin binding protein MftB